jgi:HD-like signal output (HDOD) protein
MSEKSVIEQIEELMAASDLELPVFNHVAMKIQDIISKDDFSTAEVSDTIQEDQALTSHVLQVSNSSFYAGLKPAKTIQDAIVRLGAKKISSLVMVVTQKKMYQLKNPTYNGWMPPLWNHALSSAIASQWLATRLGLNKFTEESFLAGLLHDIGKLLLLRIIDDLQESGLLQMELTDTITRDILDTMHCSQGEKHMQRLNMPETYCLVVGHHHGDTLDGESVIVNLVRLANLTCHKLGIGLNHDEGLMLSATPEATNLMANDMLLAELQIELEEKMAAMDSAL